MYLLNNISRKKRHNGLVLATYLLQPGLILVMTFIVTSTNFLAEISKSIVKIPEKSRQTIKFNFLGINLTCKYCCQLQLAKYFPVNPDLKETYLKTLLLTSA